MTVQELRDEYRKHNPQGRFFDTLSERGESVDEMRVTGIGIFSGEICIELVATQSGILGYSEKRHYFDTDNYIEIA